MSAEIPSSYFIKPSYTARSQPQYFEDKAKASGHPIVWQPEVYEWARRLARQLRCRTIIDLGSGNGEKLSAMHPEFSVVGVDFGKNLDYCREKYPFGLWLEANFEQGPAIDVGLDAARLAESVIICSDVIEHLADPMPLLRGLLKMLEQAPVAVVSTPERNLTRGMQDKGPPLNPCHVREWSLAELTRLFQASGFNVVHAGLTLSNDREPHHHTCLHLLAHPARKIDLAEKPGKTSRLAYWTECLRVTARKLLRR